MDSNSLSFIVVYALLGRFLQFSHRGSDDRSNDTSRSLEEGGQNRLSSVKFQP